MTIRALLSADVMGNQFVKSKLSIRYFEYALVGIMLCLAALLLQWFSGSWFSEYSSYADEPAHYVTSMLVYEYIKSDEYFNPLGFAKNYYTHYPKVSIGHWPPVFYALLGMWFVIFGTAKISAMSFIAIVAATTSLVIYHIAKTKLGTCAAVFSSLLFLMLPFVQQATNAVMLGHVVSLFTLLCVVFLAKFLTTKKIIHGLLFSLFASLAVLTRGSAWAIGLMPILTMLFAWKFKMLKSFSFWLTAVPVLVLCGVWYLNTPSLNTGAFVGQSVFNIEFTINAIPHFLIAIYAAVGALIAVFAVIGMFVKVVLPAIRREKVENIWPALVALCIATYILHIFVAASFDDRYMLPTIPAVILLAVAGIDWFICICLHKFRKKYIDIVAYGVIFSIIIFTKFSVYTVPNYGYALALNEITNNQLDVSQQVVLVTSDAIGEGAVIAEAASKRRENDFVLRGSKVFVERDWYGRVFEEKLKTTVEISNLLHAIPVNAVILDTSIYEDDQSNYHHLLKTLLFEEDKHWQLIGRYPVVRDKVRIEDALIVFVAKQSETASAKKLVDADFIRTLYGI